jgi:hypothetical protein
MGNGEWGMIDPKNPIFIASPLTRDIHNYYSAFRIPHSPFKGRPPSRNRAP